MKIVLSGYGKMGHMIEEIAKERGHHVLSRLDPLAPGADHQKLCPELARELSAEADVILDFSIPTEALANIRAALGARIPMVIGTTGWLDALEEVRGLAAAAGVSAVYGSNYSLGVQLFFKLVKAAAALMDGHPVYDAAGLELHHRQKADSPSGTALSVGRILLDGMKRKTTLVTEAFDRAPTPEELHMASVRVGSIPGTHKVIFDSPFDTIELSHTARTREGFARGAVWAAEWVAAHRGKGLLEVNEIFTEL